MDEYIGLDVSMKETAISIRRDGKRVWRGKCASDPKVIAALLHKRAPSAKRVVFETGPSSVWFYHAPLCRRHAGYLHRCAPCESRSRDGSKQDRCERCGWLGASGGGRLLSGSPRKGFESMLTRTLVAARSRLVRIKTELSNQIRGIMKTFGLVVPAGKGSKFEEDVRELLTDRTDLASILLPLLEVWRSMRLRVAELSRQLISDARKSEACQPAASRAAVAVATATGRAAAPTKLIEGGILVNVAGSTVIYSANAPGRSRKSVDRIAWSKASDCGSNTLDDASELVARAEREGQLPSCSQLAFAKLNVDGIQARRVYLDQDLIGRRLRLRHVAYIETRYTVVIVVLDGLHELTFAAFVGYLGRLRTGGSRA